MESNPQYTSLIDMGCSPVLSEAAILSLKSQDLSALLDWISDHSEEEEKWKTWVQEKRKGGAQEEQGPAQGETAVSIDTLINKEFCDQLVKQGHSKIVAQKALLFTQSTSLKMAENWIEDHKYDADFQEEVVITQQAQAPKLTPEEAKQKLKQLTEKARAIKKQREEQQAREREKNRLKSGKQAAATKQILEQQAKKRQAELDRIQKAKDEEYKKQLLEQMRRERNQKLGIKEEPSTAKLGNAPVAKKQQVVYTRPEQVELQCEQVKVGMHAYPEKAKTFFETAQIYVNNIIKNNGEEKFRKINKENKAFQGRIVEVFGGVETLQVIGYEEDSGFLVLKQWDMKELQAISAILQRYAGYYN